ncbi:hypothetical protein BACI349Y_550023 [Bacillus sp. 349Y]|nr:hypothetical protein BACI349Y_550023 [Bacillus sp. 349Y]
MYTGLTFADENCVQTGECGLSKHILRLLLLSARKLVKFKNYQQKNISDRYNYLSKMFFLNIWLIIQNFMLTYHSIYSGII